MRCIAVTCAVALFLAATVTASAQTAGMVQVTGIVTNEFGAPVPLLIQAIRLDDPSTQVTTSDATGHYSIALPPGAYEFFASSDNATTLLAQLFDVPASTGPLTLNLSVHTKDAVLSGTIRDAVSGRPLANAFVELDAGDPINVFLFQVGNASTDASGHYSVPIVRGTYARVVGAGNPIPSASAIVSFGSVSFNNATNVRDFGLPNGTGNAASCVTAFVPCTVTVDAAGFTPNSDLRIFVYGQKTGGQSILSLPFTTSGAGTLHATFPFTAPDDTYTVQLAFVTR